MSFNLVEKGYDKCPNCETFNLGWVTNKEWSGFVGRPEWKNKKIYSCKKCKSIYEWSDKI